MSRWVHFVGLLVLLHICGSSKGLLIKLKTLDLSGKSYKVLEKAVCDPSWFINNAKNITQAYLSNATKRTRRSWKSITIVDRLKYLRALANSDLLEKWKSFVCFHATDSQYGNFHTSSHLGVQLRFLPWHSLFLFHFEEVLGVTIPYWDWASTGLPLQDSLLSNFYFGGDGGAWNECADLSQSPLRLIHFDSLWNSHCLQRSLTSGALYNRMNELHLMSSRDPYSFLKEMDTFHANMHGAIGGFFSGHSSPIDPLFWMYHANIDRLWLSWMAKTKYPLENILKIDVDASKVSHGMDLDGYPNIKIDEFWPPNFNFPVSYGPTIDGTQRKKRQLDLTTETVVASQWDTAEPLKASPLSQLLTLVRDYSREGLAKWEMKREEVATHSTEPGLPPFNSDVRSDCGYWFLDLWTDVRALSINTTFIFRHFILGGETPVGSIPINPLLVQQLKNLVATCEPQLQGSEGEALVDALVMVYPMRFKAFANNFVKIAYFYSLFDLCMKNHSSTGSGLFSDLHGDSTFGSLLLQLTSSLQTSDKLSNLLEAELRLLAKAGDGDLDTPNTVAMVNSGVSLSNIMTNLVGATSLSLPDVLVSNSTTKRAISTQVPAEWTCKPEYYNANDGCHCDCGAEDPDCIQKSSFTQVDMPILGCRAGGNLACLSGHCFINNNVPKEWKCNPVYYNATDGCDCECGIHDPDCDQKLPNQYRNRYPDLFVIYGCNGGKDPVCSSDDQCTYREVIPPSWTCPIYQYNSGDVCDCSCGAFDPDCLIPQLAVHNCPCPENMTCRDPNKKGICEGSCGGFKVITLAEDLPATTTPPTTPPPTTPPPTTPPPTTSPPTCPTPPKCPDCPQCPAPQTQINLNFNGMLNGKV